MHIIHEVYQTFQTNMDCAQEMLKARRKWKKLILRTISFHLYPIARKTSWQGELFKSKMKNKKALPKTIPIECVKMYLKEQEHGVYP